MEKINLPEYPTQNPIVIEEAKAVTMNDALAKTKMHYHKFALFDVR